MSEHPRLILIAGPTASGKSALALHLAEKLGGAIINADSMQVYRDLRVLTSRPSAADEARAPHILYGHADAADAYSAGRFLAEVRPILATAGQPLIFVGGTGLYFDALTRGLSAEPPVPEDVRAYWRGRGQSEAPEKLHAELRKRDPVMAAKLRASDPQRIVRALEVIDATGMSLAEWHGSAEPPLVDPEQAARIVLTIDRTELRTRIARRFEAMIGEGALGEVGHLVQRGLDPALPAMKAIGVPQLAAHLRGEIGLNEAIQRAVIETGQYAKRQETWFRNRLGNWGHFGPEAAAERLTGRPRAGNS